MSPSPLPRHWQWAGVADITESVQYGYTESATSDPVGPRFLRITDIQDRQVDWGTVPYCTCSDEDLRRYALSSGDIIVARTGATTGKSYLIQFCPTAIFASYLIRLRVRSGVDPHYLALFFQSSTYWAQIARSRKGSAQPGVNASVLASLKVPLAPSGEQRRIVNEIEKQFSRLDAGIAALKRAQAALKRYRASVLQAACEGRLVPTEAELARQEGREYEPADRLLDRILKERRARWETDQLEKMKAQGKAPKDDLWKAKYQEPAGPQISGLPELPEGWSWTTLGSISDLKGGITKGGKHSPDVTLLSVPYLRVANVQRGLLDLADVHKIQATERQLSELRLLPGDILLNEGGDRDKLGRGWVWNGEIADCIHQNHVFRARLHTQGLQPKFISLYGNSGGRNYFMKAGRQTTNLASINLTLLGLLPVPVPPPAEQPRILAEVERRFSILDVADAAVTTQLRRAERLRQAILQRAFEGKLVPQDANDEPASVLLNRIRAAAPGNGRVERGHAVRGRRRASREAEPVLPVGEAG